MFNKNLLSDILNYDVDLSLFSIILLIVLLYFGWVKRKQFLKDWEKYERGEAGIPKLLKNKSEQDIANILLLMFLVFTMPLGILLVAVYYYYSDTNKRHFHAWLGTLTREKDNY